MSDVTAVQNELNELLQSPEFADAIGNAFAKALTNRLDDSESDLRLLLPLLKENTRKFQEMTAASVHDSAELMPRMMPVGKKLAQFVSQRINRAKDDLLRLQLEISLAEYEAAFAKVTAKERLINQVIGRWAIVDGKGNVVSVWTLTNSLEARKSHVPDAIGTWDMVGNEVRITWSDGWRDALRFLNYNASNASTYNVHNAGAVKLAYKLGTNWDDIPTNMERARKE